MSWSEKLSIQIAKKLISPDSPQTVGQVSHGIEISLLYLLTILTLVLGSWLLHTFVETVVLTAGYFLYRNFTGGVHLKHPHTCFIAGNVLILLLSLLTRTLPINSTLMASLLVFFLFSFSYVVNFLYAPAKHTYVQISDEIRRRSKKIILFLLILGCIISILLLYCNYWNIAFAYSFAVSLQALLLMPFSFRLVKRFGL